MEKKSRKKFVSCRLEAYQDSGRIRWCIGHEKKWQIILKKLVFLPVILLLVIVIIFATRHKVTSRDKNEHTHLSNEINVPGTFPENISYTKSLRGENREKRNTVRKQRFSYLSKRCYKLYMKVSQSPKEKESFFETENNRHRKFDYRKAYPAYFDINSDYFPIKHREKFLKKCAKNNWWNEHLYIATERTHTKKYKRSSLKEQKPKPKKNMSSLLSNEVQYFWTNKKNATEVRQLQGKIMQQYMNAEVNPCDNFYEYACGNWHKYYTIPPDRAVYDTFEMVRENLDKVLRNLLCSHSSDIPTVLNKSSYHSSKDFVNEEHVTFDPSDAVSKARFFYKSCMNEDNINKRGEKPLKKILEELGGWPVITPNWKASDFDLTWVLSRLKLLNNDILISQWIGPDIKNSNKYIIHIDETSLGLPSRDYFLDSSNQKFIKAYKSFISSIANLLGAAPDTLFEDIDDIIHFETILAAITSSLEDRRNISEMYFRTNIETLIQHFPNFAWERYFTVILGKEIDMKSPVACYCPRYINQLINLLSKTNPRTIQNYLLWRFVRHRTNNLDHRFMEIRQKFSFALFGREKQPPRWQFCVAQTNLNMGMALGSMFVKNYFNTGSKTDTVQITEMLLESFKDMIFENTWLDRQSKIFATMKINLIDLKIGFPDFLLNSTELNIKYSDVEISEQYFFENVLSVLRHASKEDQKRVDLLVNKSVWNTPPAVVNAYYSRNKNQITFPAGILQPPFYHAFFPKALNFGGIGVVIGHEITHGFDDKGRRFDYRGNLKLWWKSEAIEKFNERSQCMIDQYGQYTLPGLKIPVNGVITQGENIADNGGLKQAFRAYETWLRENPDSNEHLPGLNMTGKQLFFLNFAQVWCGKQRTETARSRLKTSVHSPGRFRVIGALSNSEEFSKVFNCPKHSPMNPKNKCVIW